MGFTGIIQIQGISPCNINITWKKYSFYCCVCLPPSFYLPVEIVFVILLFLFHYLLFQSLYLICLKYWPCIVFVDYLNACGEIPARHIICTEHLHAYNSLLKMGMIWCKNHPPLCWLKKYLYNQKRIYFRCLISLTLEHYVKVLMRVG